jgi:hypothetical protein
VGNYVWPIIISGGTISTPVVITLSEDIMLTQAGQYFTIQRECIC